MAGVLLVQGRLLAVGPNLACCSPMSMDADVGFLPIAEKAFHALNPVVSD